MTSAVDYPVGITHCGVPSWIQSMPERAVTMNQGTTEIDYVIGFKPIGSHDRNCYYLDDEIWSKLEDDSNKVPVLAKDSYPDINILLSLFAR
jgi:iron complex transport system substrate-binding protein